MAASPHRLAENQGLAFVGDPARENETISAARARRLWDAPNPHGRPNCDVVRPWAGAEDLLRRPRRRWIIDFPPGMDAREAALYELPYAIAGRLTAGGRVRRRPAGPPFGTPRAELRVALAKRERVLATPVAGRLRLYGWLPPDTLPERTLVAFARDDDWFMGILHSRLHDAWARRFARRYTPATLETFPFPWPPATPLGKLTRPQDDQRSAIALAAAALQARRAAWLAERPARRTLAALYGSRPAWLIDSHAQLDDAVAAAYGWPADLPDDEIVTRLRSLNQQRAAPA